MTPPDLDPFLDAARAHGRPNAGGRYRRIVVRMAAEDVARLDAVRARLPRTSRAALVRACTLATLAALGAALPDRCAP